MSREIFLHLSAVNPGTLVVSYSQEPYRGAWRGAGSVGSSGLFGFFGLSGSENEMNERDKTDSRSG
jgi:hypothetical protein